MINNCWSTEIYDSERKEGKRKEMIAETKVKHCRKLLTEKISTIKTPFNNLKTVSTLDYCCQTANITVIDMSIRKDLH